MACCLFGFRKFVRKHGLYSEVSVPSSAFIEHINFSISSADLLLHTTELCFLLKKP